MVNVVGDVAKACHIQKKMKPTLKKLGAVCAMSMALYGYANALEVEELNSTALTLTHANTSFSKDYRFVVLEDLSVRRIWPSAGKTITVDFNISTDKAIAIFIDYQNKDNAEEALQDAQTLIAGRVEEIKWRLVKADTAKKLGMGQSRYMRFEDNSMLMWEKGEGSDCSRLVWFASPPKINRMELSEASEFAGKTAMGNRGVAQGDLIKKIRENEERLLNGSGTARPTPQKTATTAAPPKTAPIKNTSPSPVQQEANNLLQKLGIPADNEVVKWGILGIAVLILLMVFQSILTARRKAKERAAFEQLLSANASGERVTVKRRTHH